MSKEVKVNLIDFHYKQTIVKNKNTASCTANSLLPIILLIKTLPFYQLDGGKIEDAVISLC